MSTETIHPQLDSARNGNRTRAYQYSAYGLAIHSAVCLPELASNSHPTNSALAPDVVIRCEEIPKQLENAQSTNGWIETNATDMLLNLTEVCGARFLIHNGAEILIEISRHEQVAAQRLAILGFCLTALLFQRGYLVLHANAVALRGATPITTGAVAICGAPGAGKSTLTVALLQRGHKLLTDDVTAVDVCNKRYVPVGYPRLKLWCDTLTHFGETSATLARVLPNHAKFHYPVDGMFQHTPQPLNAICLLTTAEVAVPSLTEIRGAAKLSAISQQIRSYLPEQLPHGSAWLFRQCALLARDCRVLKIARPMAGDSIAAVTDLVEKNLACAG